jgi:hypothetical protein
MEEYMKRDIMISEVEWTERKQNKPRSSKNKV